MGIRVGPYDKTTYDYDRLVTLSPQIVRLRPAPHTRTPIISFSLRIEPKEHFINWQQDPLNSNEAEARRRARFYPFAHTPVLKAVPPLEENPYYPATLDMRRSGMPGGSGCVTVLAHEASKV